MRVTSTGAGMISARRLLPSTVGALGIAALLFPEGASAHGIVGRADLPIPVWLFSWTAAIVLVVSFVALSDAVDATAAAARATQAPV